MRRVILLPAIVFAILALYSGCKIINFDAQTLYVTVAVDEDFHVQSSSTEFDETEEVNLADAFADLEMDQVDSIYVQMVSIIVTRNGTGPNTSASGTLKFEDISSTGAVVLGNFDNVNLDSVLNEPIDPFSLLSMLNLNAQGVTKLEDMVQQIPPPIIRIYFSGTINQPPVDFDCTVHLEFLVKMRP
jgi:hypothetical protein